MVKTLNKFTIFFNDKDSHQSWYRGYTSQHNEGHLWQAPANIKLNGIQKVFHWKSEVALRMPPLSSLLFNAVLDVPATASYQMRERNKGIQIGKEEVTIATLWRLHGIIYKKNPKVTIKKLLELINGFSKVVYRINLKKSVSFLYLNNELPEKESRKKKFLLKKRIQLLEINLTKKDTYTWKLYNSVGNWRWYSKKK